MALGLKAAAFQITQQSRDVMRNFAKSYLREASYALPAALFMALLFGFPLLGIVYQSIQRVGGDGLTLAAYGRIFTTPLFLRVALTTLEISVGAAFCSLLLAYPVAYFLAKQPPRRQALYLILVLIPFWTSSLVKSFSLMVLLGHAGIINQLLAAVGVGPVNMLFNRLGVMIGMSHYLIPFMVFPILTSLRNQPPELGRAAAIMGAGKLRIFMRVTFPLSLPGVVTGLLLVFILSLGFYIIPALLGGRRDIVFGNLVDFYVREVLNWPMAAAVAVLLVLVAVTAAMLLAKIRGGSSLLSEGGR
jgi:putative spermidine/putrescine transport system permease protein